MRTLRQGTHGYASTPRILPSSVEILTRARRIGRFSRLRSATKSSGSVIRQRGMPRFVAEFPKRIFIAVMLAGSALITVASLPYFDFETLPLFVIEKLPVRFESLWLASLRIHVASALLSFP